MNSTYLRFSVLMIALIVFVAACGGPIALPGASDPADSSPADSAPADSAPADSAPADSAPATEAAPASEATSVPSVQHNNIPVSLPANQSGEAGDFDSSEVIESGSLIGGDRFTFGRFERPFNANTMDMYYAELDIVNTSVFQDDQWIYGSLSIKELGATSSTAKYALELDTNVNGKADFLVVSDKPASTEWTVAGVRVYQDANQNVGGEFPMLTDNVKPDSDGFETLFFDQGNGENPDTAWVRISPADANVVEFAINRAAIANPTKYLINFWAGRNLDPAIFDLNDAFTQEEAGAADEGLPAYYPIKAIAEIDNSCRMAVGFQVTGYEPGLCDIFIPQKVKELAPPPGVPTACVERVCNGGFWNQEKCDCDYPK